MNEYRWSDLRVGLTASFECSPSERDVAAFRLLSGDENPLHRDEAFAIANGFEGVVVHGLMVSSYYSRLAGMYLPGKYCLLHGIDLHFPRPVYAGARLTVSGEITYMNEAFRQAEIRASISDGEAVVSKAKIRVGVRE